MGIRERVYADHQSGRCDCTDTDTPVWKCASLDTQAKAIAAEEIPSLAHRVLHRLGR